VAVKIICELVAKKLIATDSQSQNNKTQRTCLPTGRFTEEKKNIRYKKKAVKKINRHRFTEKKNIRYKKKAVTCCHQPFG
jgi:hypothetical protein